MALLAEEIVEEWLRRDGHFTMRGIRVGNGEIDLLAVKRWPDDKVVCRHIEVQAAIRAISYITHDTSAKHLTNEKLREQVEKWVSKKFRLRQKKEIMKSLWDASWTSELVVNDVRYEEEIPVIEEYGVTVHRLKHVIEELASGRLLVPRASGADLVDLVQLGSNTRPQR
jgi:Holliday junction resolvase-like predicted endonuclease